MDRRLKPESKKAIIRCAYQVLRQEGVEQFSIRQVAKACGCAVSNIYRHFSSKDELILHAGLLYVYPYLQEISGGWNYEEDSLQRYLRVEKTFAKYSFAEPLLFYNMYFSNVSKNLDGILQDSMGLFEELYQDMPQDLSRMLSVSGGFSQRNLAMLEQCRADGFLDIGQEQLAVLNNGVVQMYRGFLDAAVASRRQGETTDTLREQYLQAHWMIHQRFFTEKAQMQPVF